MTVPGYVIAKLIGRHLITGLGAWLVSRGLLDPDEIPAFAKDAAGVALFLGGVAWSYRTAFVNEIRVLCAAITGHPDPDIHDPVISEQVTALRKAGK